MTNPELDRWNSRYAAPEYVFGTVASQFIVAQKALLPAQGRALAVADGEGRNGVWLAEQGLDVVSLDFSHHAQTKARALARQRGVALTCEFADVTAWSWPPDEFDVVAVVFTQFAAPAERAAMFAGVRQTLKPGGLLLLHGYTPRQLAYATGGPSARENLYTSDLLEAAFGDFDDLDVREYDTVLQEGSGHGGMSALIDLCGRKPRA